jgi:hypothetical protein
MFKDSMKNFNQSLGLAIRNGMTKGSKWARQSDNPLINLLGALLLPNDRLKTRTDTANYNKGPVPFDGVTRKSIVEVIPTYLSKIYAALGGEEKYYDYQTGRFMSIPQIQKKHDDDIKYAALQAGGDFRKDVMSRMSSPALKQEVDNFFIHAFMLGETYDTIEQNIDNQQWLKRFGLSKRAAKVIVNELDVKYRMLNATINNKKDFDTVVEEAKIYEGIVLIMDEIHRMNKDKQDLLLPYVESGLITLIGLTTSNPYHSINPAIRSRCQIFER